MIRAIIDWILAHKIAVSRLLIGLAMLLAIGVAIWLSGMP